MDIAMNVVFDKSAGFEMQTENEKIEVLDGIKYVSERINDLYSVFNNVSDPELIESCIYEINALQAKYTYFLNRARLMGIENNGIFDTKEKIKNN